MPVAKIVPVLEYDRTSTRSEEFITNDNPKLALRTGVDTTYYPIVIKNSMETTPSAYSKLPGVIDISAQDDSVTKFNKLYIASTLSPTYS